MASKRYIAKKLKAHSELQSKRGIRGNEVKRQRRIERAEAMKVVGGFRTFGSMGEHLVEILDCGDNTHNWLRVDGVIRQPRTPGGIRKILAEWVRS